MANPLSGIRARENQCLFVAEAKRFYQGRDNDL
jgi:hypothetical protein